MASVDLLSNYVCSLKNACLAHKENFEGPASKLLIAVSKVLKDQGIVNEFRVIRKKNKLFLQVKPAFGDRNKSILKDIRKISKPGLRQYWSVAEIKQSKILNYGHYLISTSKGVMVDRDAVNQGIGGEVLCLYLNN